MILLTRDTRTAYHRGMPTTHHTAPSASVVEAVRILHGDAAADRLAAQARPARNAAGVPLVDPFLGELDPADDWAAANWPTPTGRNRPIDLRPERDACGCGYDLCGECMRTPGPRRHMVVPGLTRVR